ncbi:MAG: SH3 domain-containing protein [Porcipelethomonas sp.]
MPKVFLSPSTQEWNEYITGGNEEQYMNLLADRMEPYMRSSGITYVRNDPNENVIGAIRDSNAGNYDVHLALHSNAAPESLSGKLRGIDIYFSPSSYESERLATIIANNLKSIYPLPDKTRAVPTTSLGEVTQTRAVAVLCELGYHDNIEDATWLKNNLDGIAKNLVSSLCDYFGIPFVNAGPVLKGIVAAGGSNLNLRDYPSVGGRVIGSIPDGATVTIYGSTDGWYVVSYNGKTGYASGDFIVVG